MSKKNLDLSFSVRSVMWGEKSENKFNTNEPDNPEFEKSGLKEKILKENENKCAFCGFESEVNEIHSINNNHHDIREGNLCVTDPICHAWNHLESIKDSDGVVAFLPGLKPQDVNHLQRTIIVALQSDDKVVRDDAKSLLNWLGSHKEYIEVEKNPGAYWETSKPSVFAKALKRVDPEFQDKRYSVFKDLVLVLSPQYLKNQAKKWYSEYQMNNPIKSWAKLYEDTKNIKNLRGE